MEVHAAPAAVGKRLWSYVRAALFMARNGKRKLLLSMHLLGANNSTKRRGTTKAVTRAVASLLTHHHAHHGHHGHQANALRRRDYEFSCSNSPATACSSSSSRRRLAYFPCLGAVAEEEQQYDYGYGYQYDGAEPETSLDRIDYYASAAAAASPSSSSSPGLLLPSRDLVDLAPGEEEYGCASASSPALLLLPGAASGEFSVRVSNYSSEDDEGGGGGGNQAVDADAEEFIRRFYDQLRHQNTTVALLPYYMQQETIAAA